MSKIKDGGPAFPRSIIYANSDNPFEIVQGLSLRDYFAAKAMQAMIDKFNIHLSHYGNEQEEEEISHLYLLVATSAYNYANAMLAERERERRE